MLGQARDEALTKNKLVTKVSFLTVFIIAQNDDRVAAMSDQDALDLVQADRMVGANMQLGRARGLVGRTP